MVLLSTHVLSTFLPTSSSAEKTNKLGGSPLGAYRRHASGIPNPGAPALVQPEFEPEARQPTERRENP